LSREIEEGRGPVFLNNFEDIIISGLRKMRIEEIRDIVYVAEGLESRIKKASSNSGNIEELIDNILTKRYTKTRIQRILINSLIEVTQKQFNLFDGPEYIRVLGFNQQGINMLRRMKKKAKLPIVMKPSKLDCEMFDIECLATDIYVLGYNNSVYKRGGQELTNQIIKA
jgi:predicted nucleotidyltransferase